MRVTTGKAKGHPLKAPKSFHIRPTTGLIRNAAFSMLELAASDWSRVLDLYAGTGALGIEALSRGAGWVDLVEREPRCCATIRLNLRKTGLSDKAHVYCCSVESALSFLTDEYGIVLLDPPYDRSPIATILEKLAASPIIGKQTLVVALHSSRLPLDSCYGRLSLIKARRHGDTTISIYQEGEN